MNSVSILAQYPFQNIYTYTGRSSEISADIPTLNTNNQYAFRYKVSKTVF